MDEARLLEKLRLIEALFAGAATEGEKVAVVEEAEPPLLADDGEAAPNPLPEEPGGRVRR